MFVIYFNEILRSLKNVNTANDNIFHSTELIYATIARIHMQLVSVSIDVRATRDVTGMITR